MSIPFQQGSWKFTFKVRFLVQIERCHLLPHIRYTYPIQFISVTTIFLDIQFCSKILYFQCTVAQQHECVDNLCIHCVHVYYCIIHSDVPPDEGQINSLHSVYFFSVIYTGVRNLVSLFGAILSDVSILFVSSSFVNLVDAQIGLISIIFPLELG